MRGPVGWPSHWALGEGWPTQEVGARPLLHEQRQWRVLAANLRKGHKRRLSDHVEQLSGPRANAEAQRRSLEQIERDALEFYRVHGRRPTPVIGGREWNANAQFLLRKYGVTLASLCTRLGIPGYDLTERSLELVRVQVEDFVKAHGRRPTQADSVQWRQTDRWLKRRHGSTLMRFCDGLGLPKITNRSRTIEQLTEDALLFYKEAGRRPTASDRGWRPNIQWLDARVGASKFFDNLGFPALFVTRDNESVNEEILAFYRANGHRPYGKHSKEWHNVEAWLARQGTTLHRRCNELGLPLRGRYSRWNRRPVSETIACASL